MARKLRVEYPGVIYHVMNRGGRREAIFRDGDAAKVALAVRLRAEMVMTVKWIAERLGMGTPGYVKHLLYRQRKAGRNNLT